MNRALVRILLWLLIAALPLQGAVAAVKACCGQARAATTQAHLAGHADASGASGAHAQHADHHAVQHAGAGEAGHDDCKGSSCSSCAGCCLGAAALPAALVFIPVFSTSPAIVLAPAAPVTGFIPGGLERPPRQFSA